VSLEGRASTGSSNVTWLVVIDGEPAVLRHPPRGDVLPTAHDLGRERRYMAALAGSGVPVPGVVAFCEQLDVIGVPFLLTSRMPGVCLLAGPAAVRDPRQLARHAVEVLAGIHAVDWERAGLVAAPGRYLERQVRRWREQLRLTPSSARLADLDVISDWLLAHLPPGEERTVVHGDFGFHNLLIDPDRSVVTAVLDWELATIGDPLSDLVSFAKGWGPDSAPPNPANVSLSAPGWRPTHDELIAWYEASTGRTLAPARRFYEVFGRWRSIGIMEGIFARTGGTRFGDEVPQLVRATTGMLDDT
jgi:aminoglycoside phosphotransferase (APT) family kinase protein